MGLKAHLAVIGVLLFTLPVSAESIRVRLSRAQSKIELSGLGLSVGTSPKDFSTTALPQVRKISIELEKNPGRWPIWIIREGSSPAQKLFGNRIFVEGETLRLGLNPIPRSVEISVQSSGRMDVVATLDLEKYLTGVLPSEMPASWPEEALKAQAVASRSYALAVTRERKDFNFDVESTIFDQVFDIRNHAEAEKDVRDKISAVVRETNGEILLDERGRPVKAHYHADCGGQTESARSVWGPAMKETGMVKDNMCPLSPWALWQYRISKSELRKTLGLDLQTAAAVGRTASGRVVSIDLILASGQIQRMTSQDFRQALGFTNLKSTNFKFFWSGDSLLIEGRGNGHGVGLCQYGARQLARRGIGYQQILSNYYPLVKLGRLPSNTMAKAD